MIQVTVEQGDIAAIAADALIVNLFEDVNVPAGATGAINRGLNGTIVDLIASGDMQGKAGEITVLYPQGSLPAPRVIVAGLGKAEEFNLEGVRRAAGLAVQRARQLNARQVATIVHGAGVGGLDLGQAAQATVEASLMALYEFDAPKTRTEPVRALTSLTVVEQDGDKVGAIRSAAQFATAIASGNALTRDLVNMPPNYATPIKMAETATEIAAEHGMGLIVGDRAWAAEHNMGAFLAVAKGAGDEPRFIVLEHNNDRTDWPAIVLVGKGITFDTGGISLKGVQGMGDMKSDMGGAAAVLGAMKTVGLLNLPLRVIGIAPCTENKPDADAYRPSDVITASNGKTIEIISTDAEGRMVLADALVYAGRYEPKGVIDLATLTGAAVVALGQGVAGALFCDEEWLRDALMAAGTATHERLWHMPLWADYKKSIKTDVADMKNSGGRFGGVATAAVFLQEFTDYPWAHLDIAGMALSTEAKPYTPAGGTGFGARLLVEFLRNQQD